MNLPELGHGLHNLAQDESGKLPGLRDTYIRPRYRAGCRVGAQRALRNREAETAQQFPPKRVNLELRQPRRSKRGGFLPGAIHSECGRLHVAVSFQCKGDRIIDG